MSARDYHPLLGLPLSVEAPLHTAVAKEPTQHPAATDRQLPQHGQMHFSTFYSRILPDQGRYVLFQNRQNIFFNSLADLAAATETRIDSQGLYFATASYGEDDARTQANVVAIKAHRLDLDAGQEKYFKNPKGTYETHAAARAGLMEFVRATKIMPTFIIASGEGLHVYYELDEAVTAAQWKPVAEKLKRVAKALGLRADPTVTADEARVLRPPGTLHKNGNRVEVIKDTGVTYTNDELDALLTPFMPVQEFPIALVRKAKGAASINDDILAGNSPPASLARVAEHCAAIAHFRDTRGNLPEPLWRLGIGVGKHCEIDGLDKTQDWSSGYVNYSPRETQEKYDRWDTPPATCNAISEHFDGCGTCKYRGKITTPKQLGYVRAVPAETECNAKGEAPREVMAADLKVALPDWRINEKNVPTKPLDTTANIAALAAAHGVVIRYNMMTRRTEIIVPGLASGRDDLDNAALAAFGDMAVKAGLNRKGLKELVDAVAGANPYHPATGWILAKPWDGTSRMCEFHGSLELAEDYPAWLRDKLMDAFFLTAIHAMLSPDGVAAQGMLVLVGAQDAFKTRWVQSLCPVLGAVRSGLSLNPADRDSVFQATSALIVELGEMDHTFRKADIAALKAFTTRNEDVLRRPYASTENTYRRRTVFVGTVNGSGFLADDTGDRRFWVVKIRRAHLFPEVVMQQVWAEYLARYQGGERGYLDVETKAALANANSEHRVIDPLQERIQGAYDWARTQQPDWTKGATWLSATDICIRVGIPQPKRADSTRAAGVVRALNGGTARRSNGLSLLALPPPMRGVQ